MRAVALALCVACLGATFYASPSAAAPSSGAAPAPTMSVGNWCFSFSPADEMVISNRINPSHVRLRLIEVSNGWFWLQTSVDQYVMWSSGDFSQQHFDRGKHDCAVNPMPPAYAFGSWTFSQSASHVDIAHSGNPHIIRLPLQSQGEVELVTQGAVQRVDPSSVLATVP